MDGTTLFKDGSQPSGFVLTSSTVKIGIGISAVILPLNWSNTFGILHNLLGTPKRIYVFGMIEEEVHHHRQGDDLDHDILLEAYVNREALSLVNYKVILFTIPVTARLK